MFVDDNDAPTTSQPLNDEVKESLPTSDDNGVQGEDIPDFDAAWDEATASSDEPTEQLRGLVEWVVTQLVDEPSQVTVTADTRGSTVLIAVRLPEEELGKVIGRGGRIAKSIRTALMIVGSRHHLRVSLDIEGQDESH